jgi:hypothetical protein
MATLGTSTYTFADWQKSIDPNGRQAKAIDMLSQKNEILTKFVYLMGNLPTGHRTTIETGLPDVYWRLLNQGTPSSKTTEAQVDLSCGMLHARNQVDKDLAELNGDVAAFRLKRARRYVERMGQEVVGTTFYGNSGVSPEEFTGLSVHYSSTTASNGQNIITAGGAGADNASIWLVGMSEDTITHIVPKGSIVGLHHEDLGLQDAFDSNNNRYRAYMDEWQWKLGFAVQDWKYAVRICNIDVSNLVAKSSAADLIEKMIAATFCLPSLNNTSTGWYMNRTMMKMLTIQRRDDVVSGGGLRFENVDGKIQYTFMGIPIYICDQLLETEALVS